MRYGIWNNKGAVGKTFLSFVLSTEYANNNPETKVVVADMCPQANLSEILLGGNGNGAEILSDLIRERKTIGGYFDDRIVSPHSKTGQESQYPIHVASMNDQIPSNLWLIAGDPSLELQAQVINQIGAQGLPVDAWKNVHNWLLDLVLVCSKNLGGRKAETVTFVDCNPSFSAYTELAMVASEQVIVPCSSDGSSARAIDNLGSLLYGLGTQTYPNGFAQKAAQSSVALPMVHSVLLNRSTQYNNRASKAFGAMFEEIKNRTTAMRMLAPQHFVKSADIFWEIPDNHSVAIVCSHLGKPLFSITPGKYRVHSENPKVNDEPLERYKSHVAAFLKSM